MVSALKTVAAADELARWVQESFERALLLTEDLTDEQLMGPRLAIVNPLLWELGHVAWFQEKWVLRHVCQESSGRQDSDALYDSIAIPHDTRWDLPLPSRQETIRYVSEVRDRVLEKLASAASDELLYFAAYTVFHTDMHCEAFTYARQTLSYPAPLFCKSSELAQSNDSGGGGSESRLTGDAEIPGGRLLLGARREEPFVFDNEKWAHAVELRPFAISRTAVTQAEYLQFVEDGGY